MSTASSSRRAYPPPTSASPGGVHPAIVATFDRAVQIVQALPTSSPIQATYEQKLGMYSLYKQVTRGNVTGSRPGMFDMLKRSKWDAWKSKENMSKEAAMRAYVEVLVQMLKHYKDRAQAKELLREVSAVMRASVATSGQLNDGEPWSSTSLTSSSSNVSSSSSSSGESTSSSPAAPLRELPSASSSTAPTPTARNSHQTAYFPPPDPSLPAPDVSPSLMNPALPSRGGTPHSDDVRHHRRAGGRPSSSHHSQQQQQRQPLAFTPYSSTLLDHAPPSRSDTPSFAFQPPRQQPLAAPLPSAFAGPSSALLPHPAPASPLPNASSSSQIQDPALSSALERIQISLLALHERLSSLEATSALLQHESYPLLALLTSFFPFLALSPSSSSVSIGSARPRPWRLLGALARRVVGDAFVLALLISIWVVLGTGKGTRRKATAEFWKSIGYLIRRRGGGGAGGRSLVG